MLVAARPESAAAQSPPGTSPPAAPHAPPAPQQAARVRHRLRRRAAAATAPRSRRSGARLRCRAAASSRTLSGVEHRLASASWRAPWSRASAGRPVAQREQRPEEAAAAVRSLPIVAAELLGRRPRDAHRRHPRGLPIWHLFVVTTDGAGIERYYRGGPGGPGRRPDRTGRSSPTTAPYVPGTVDWSPGAPSRTVMAGPTRLRARRLPRPPSCAGSTRPHRRTRPTGPNSNTTAATILANCNIPLGKPVVGRAGLDAHAPI